MKKENGNKSGWLFWIILGFLIVNLLSITVLNQYLPAVRFIRQPAMGIFLLGLLHYFPKQEINTTIYKPFFRFFQFGLFYLAFNVATSLDKVNSATYSLWLIGLFFFLFHLLILRNSLPFFQTLKAFLKAGLLLGIIILIISYIGGYIFQIDSFFDERFNYTVGTMKTEFAGIFGSNNSLGMGAFYTSAFFLLYSLTQKNKSTTLLYFLLSIATSGLVFQIGNRASMLCLLVLWVLYFTWVRASIMGFLILMSTMVVLGVAFQDDLTEKLRLEQFEGGNVLGNRSVLFAEAVEITENMDFFGVGYQNQRLSRKHFRLVSENDKEYNFHNSYLATIAELGWFGLFWIPGFILYGLFVFRARNDIPDQNKKLIRMIQALLLIICLFHLPVEDSVNSPGSPFFLWFWGLFFILILGKSEENQDE